MVAVGGRGTLIGAVLGAVLVSFGETYINDLSREAWPIILGALFIGVVLFMPEGIVGWLRKQSGRMTSWRLRKQSDVTER
jgi:urea transport system permease protein